MMWLRKSKKGFTLIELMVVVAIIAVLSLLGIRVYTGQATKAKNSSVQANVHSLATELGVRILNESAPSFNATMINASANSAQIVNPFVPGDKGEAVLNDGAADDTGGNIAGKIYYSDEDTDGDDTPDAYRLEGIKNDGTILLTTDVNYQ